MERIGNIEMEVFEGVKHFRIFRGCWVSEDNFLPIFETHIREGVRTSGNPDLDYTLTFFRFNKDFDNRFETPDYVELKSGNKFFIKMGIIRTLEDIIPRFVETILLDKGILDYFKPVDGGYEYYTKTTEGFKKVEDLSTLEEETKNILRNLSIDVDNYLPRGLAITKRQLDEMDR